MKIRIERTEKGGITDTISLRRPLRRKEHSKDTMKNTLIERLGDDETFKTTTTIITFDSSFEKSGLSPLCMFLLVYFKHSTGRHKTMLLENLPRDKLSTLLHVKS